MRLLVIFNPNAAGGRAAQLLGSSAFRVEGEADGRDVGPLFAEVGRPRLTDPEDDVGRGGRDAAGGDHVDLGGVHGDRRAIGGPVRDAGRDVVLIGKGTCSSQGDELIFAVIPK